MNTMKNTKNWRASSDNFMIEERKAKFENVMIIDDAVLDLYVVSQMIIKVNLGKNILQYSTAQEALLYLTAHQENIQALPDVIFVDIYMPLMSGFEFMKAYDKLSPTLKNYCRLFILSSTSNTQDIERIRFDKNVAGIQEKPVTKYFLENIQQ